MSCEGNRLINEFAEKIGTSPELIGENIPKWANVKLTLKSEEIDVFINQVADAVNYKNSPYVINEIEMKQIYSKLFG